MANANCAMSPALDSENRESITSISLDGAPHMVSARMAVIAVVIANCNRQAESESSSRVTDVNAATANDAIADNFAANEFAFVSQTRNCLAVLHCFGCIDATAASAAVSAAASAAPLFAIMTPILQTNPSFFLFLTPSQTEVFFGAND